MINRSALNPTFVPTRLRVSRPLCLFVAALLLLVLQLLSGTGPVYALLVFALLAVSYAAVSWAGGLETLFGIAIAYLLLQNVLISQIAKVYFWEAADSGLRQPVTTLGVYLGRHDEFSRRCATGESVPSPDPPSISAGGAAEPPLLAEYPLHDYFYGLGSSLPHRRH